MRKAGMIILIITVISLMGACSFLRKDDQMAGKQGTDEESAKIRIEEVLNAIKSNDEEGMKALFSQTALKEVDDFSATADYLFGFIQGEVQSWEQYKFTSGGHIDYGKKSLYFQAWYTIVTTKATYKCYIYDYYIDTINQDNEGLYTLRFWNANTEVSDWQDLYLPGINKGDVY